MILKIFVFEQISTSTLCNQMCGEVYYVATTFITLNIYTGSMHSNITMSILYFFVMWNTAETNVTLKLYKNVINILSC